MQPPHLVFYQHLLKTYPDDPSIAERYKARVTSENYGNSTAIVHSEQDIPIAAMTSTNKEPGWYDTHAAAKHLGIDHKRLYYLRSNHHLTPHVHYRAFFGRGRKRAVYRWHVDNLRTFLAQQGKTVA